MNEYKRSPFMPVTPSEAMELLGKSWAKVSTRDDLVYRYATTNEPAAWNRELSDRCSFGLLWDIIQGRSPWTRVRPLWRQVTPALLQELHTFRNAMTPDQMACLKSLPADGEIGRTNNKRLFVMLWWVAGLNEKKRDFTQAAEANPDFGRLRPKVLLVCTTGVQERVRRLCEAAQVNVQLNCLDTDGEDSLVEMLVAIGSERIPVIFCTDTVSNGNLRLIHKFILSRGESDRCIVARFSENHPVVSSSDEFHVSRDVLPIVAARMNYRVTHCQQDVGVEWGSLATGVDEIRDGLTRLQASFGDAIVSAVSSFSLGAIRESVKHPNRRVQFNLDAQAAFMRIAHPIYSNSQKIYATSNRTVSTFWMREPAQCIALLPACETTRLFIFQDQNDFGDDCKVLIDHLGHYESSGVAARYYVTSERSWKEWCRKSGKDFTEDVAYAVPADGRKMPIEFRLTNAHGSMATIDNPLNECHWQMIDSLRGNWPTLDAFQFKPDFFSASRREESIGSVARVFGAIVPRTGVHHVLVFTGDRRIEISEIKKIVLAVRGKLLSKQEVLLEKYGLIDVSFGQRIGDSDFAARAPQAVRTESANDQLVLIMRFKDEDGLRRYYAQEDDVVRDIFDELYRRLREVLRLRATAKELRDILETAGCSYYSRVDYTDGQTLVDWFESVQRRLSD
jgi:hypothetical protein